MAWVQRKKRKRGDGDPENHTDYTDLAENAQGSGGPPEGEERNHGGPQTGEGEGEAAETHACNADCDLEEQQRVERELEEERALQEEWEQDRALHEEWVQKTIDEYLTEEDDRGANRPPEGTTQMQTHQQHHHVAAVTMALNRWMVGATATGGMEIEVDSVVEVLTHVLNLNQLLLEEEGEPTLRLTVLYQIMSRWRQERAWRKKVEIETMGRIWQGYLEALHSKGARWEGAKLMEHNTEDVEDPSQAATSGGANLEGEQTLVDPAQPAGDATTSWGGLDGAGRKTNNARGAVAGEGPRLLEKTVAQLPPTPMASMASSTSTRGAFSIPAVPQGGHRVEAPGGPAGE